MCSFPRSLLALGVLVIGSVAAAGEPTPLVKPLLTQPGKLLLREDLDKPFSDSWRHAKGKWQAVEGAMKGTQVLSDMHTAAARRELKYQNAVIQLSFKLDGAKALHLSINADKGHLCRVVVTTKGMTILKDAAVKKVDKREPIASRTFAIKPGEWHTLSLEMLGKDILACVDGKEVAFGTHPGLERGKAEVGLIVVGESAWFKDLRTWEATANPNWAATRAKLQEDRSKVSSNPK